MAESKKFVFYKGWAEVEGRKLAKGRPDPKTLYQPRVDGVMPVEPLPSDNVEEDDDSRVPVDVLIRRRLS